MAIKKILIVDDSPTERHVLNDLLTKAGYEVVASDNGEDAILKARLLKPDLILMDVVMPDQTGLDLAPLQPADFFATLRCQDQQFDDVAKFIVAGRAPDGHKLSLLEHAPSWAFFALGSADRWVVVA